MARRAETLGELAGVDADRTGCCAEAVGRAGVEGVVGKRALERSERAVAFAREAKAFNLAADDDALARRRRQVAAGASRLAEAALDALVHLFFDGGHRLQVLEV